MLRIRAFFVRLQLSGVQGRSFESRNQLCENNIYDEVKVSHVCVISGFNGKMCTVLEKLKPYR